jgi:hypothetical protein
MNRANAFAGRGAVGDRNGIAVRRIAARIGACRGSVREFLGGGGRRAGGRQRSGCRADRLRDDRRFGEGVARECGDGDGNCEGRAAAAESQLQAGEALAGVVTGEWGRRWLAVGVAQARSGDAEHGAATGGQFRGPGFGGLIKEEFLIGGFGGFGWGGCGELGGIGELAIDGAIADAGGVKALREREEYLAGDGQPSGCAIDDSTAHHVLAAPLKRLTDRGVSGPVRRSPGRIVCPLTLCSVVGREASEGGGWRVIDANNLHLRSFYI